MVGKENRVCNVCLQYNQQICRLCALHRGIQAIFCITQHDAYANRVISDRVNSLPDPGHLAWHHLRGGVLKKVPW